MRVIYLGLILGASIMSTGASRDEPPLKDLVVQEKVKGTAHTSQGKVKFEAKKALINKAEGSLEMDKDVKINTETGLSLETNTLKWRQKESLITTEDKVKITKDKKVEIKGEGLKADIGLKEAQIDKKVEVRVLDENRGFVMITCEGPLEISYGEGKAVFNREVKVSQRDSELYSDKATLYFDVKNKTLEKIVAEGNVRIVRGRDTSYSQKATYFADTKKIVLEGSPRLVIFPQNNSFDIFGNLEKEKPE